MRRLLCWAPVFLGALAALTVGTAWVLERFVAQQVQIIVPAAPEEVALNEELWTAGDSVAAIYGVPAGEPVRVLFADPEQLLYPEREPGLVLLRVDKQAGDNPLQVRTVWFVAWRAAAGFGLAALAALGLTVWRGRGRRTGRSGAAPPSALPLSALPPENDESDASPLTPNA